MPAAELAPLMALSEPYPGLRPFEMTEAFLFYGRQSHTDDLLRRLPAARFLAVVGTSGSGKSSLVRAGLLPALYRGFLVGATSRWRIAVMRPGNAPLDNLMKALSDRKVGPERNEDLSQLISRSSLGLVEAVRQTRLAKGESVLVVVDQFEELFRFQRERRQQDGGAEASLFVSSLLEAAGSFGVSVYVVITMRSDFLGDCTQFPGLAEALNSSQYLIPRLSREQRREAIENPLLLVGARMVPRLVQRLLNELGDDPDQLPVLQHALNRTFHKWKDGGSRGDIDFGHYEAAGTLKGALNDHAELLLDGLKEAARPWAQGLLRCLTTFDGGRAIRRPARLDRIYAVLGAKSLDEQTLVRDVIHTYASSENSLLVSTSGMGLRADTVIDISHESLIRNWQRLREWLVEENSSVGWYRSVAEDTVRNRTKDAGLWRDPELARALSFCERGQWNEAWAERNQLDRNASFGDVRDFLMRSSDDQRREQREEEARRQKDIDEARALAAAEGRAKRWRTGIAVMVVALLVAGGVIVFALQQLKATELRLAAVQTEVDSKNAQIDQARRQEEVLKALSAEAGQSAQEQKRLSIELEKLRSQTRDLINQRNEALKNAEAIRQGSYTQGKK